MASPSKPLSEPPHFPHVGNFSDTAAVLRMLRVIGGYYQKSASQVQTEGQRDEKAQPQLSLPEEVHEKAVSVLHPLARHLQYEAPEEQVKQMADSIAAEPDIIDSLCEGILNPYVKEMNLLSFGFRMFSGSRIYLIKVVEVCLMEWSASDHMQRALVHGGCVHLLFEQLGLLIKALDLGSNKLSQGLIQAAAVTIGNCVTAHVDLYMRIYPETDVHGCLHPYFECPLPLISIVCKLAYYQFCHYLKDFKEGSVESPVDVAEYTDLLCSASENANFIVAHRRILLLGATDLTDVLRYLSVNEKNRNTLVQHPRFHKAVTNLLSRGRDGEKEATLNLLLTLLTSERPPFENRGGKGKGRGKGKGKGDTGAAKGGSSACALREKLCTEAVADLVCAIESQQTHLKELSGAVQWCVEQKAPEDAERNVSQCLSYVKCCYRYKHYDECWRWADHMRASKAVSREAVDQFLLVKAKALFHIYHRKRVVIHRKERSYPNAKELKREKKIKVYDHAKEVASILGSLKEKGVEFDEECEQYLDYALMDYIRELNEKSTSTMQQKKNTKGGASNQANGKTEDHKKKLKMTESGTNKQTESEIEPAKRMTEGGPVESAVSMLELAEDLSTPKGPVESAVPMLELTEDLSTPKGPVESAVPMLELTEDLSTSKGPVESAVPMLKLTEDLSTAKGPVESAVPMLELAEDLSTAKGPVESAVPMLELTEDLSTAKGPVESAVPMLKLTEDLSTAKGPVESAVPMLELTEDLSTAKGPEDPIKPTTTSPKPGPKPGTKVTQQMIEAAEGRPTSTAVKVSRDHSVFYCMLCHKKGKVIQSHIVPYSVLREVIGDKKILTLGPSGLSWDVDEQKKSIEKFTHFLLCDDCDNRVLSQDENQFKTHVLSQIYDSKAPAKPMSEISAIPYDQWLYRFCVGILFRGLVMARIISIATNEKEIYHLFRQCRSILLTGNVQDGPTVALFFTPGMGPLKQSVDEKTGAEAQSGVGESLKPASEQNEKETVDGVPNEQVTEKEREVEPEDEVHSKLPQTSIGPREEPKWQLEKEANCHRNILVALNSGIFFKSSATPLLNTAPSLSRKQHYYAVHFGIFTIVTCFEPVQLPPKYSKFIVSPNRGELSVPPNNERMDLNPPGLQVLYREKAYRSVRVGTELILGEHNIVLIELSDLMARDDRSGLAVPGSAPFPLSLLPSGFDIDRHTNAISLPEGHQILLHDTLRRGSASHTIMLACNEREICKVDKPYVIIHTFLTNPEVFQTFGFIVSPHSFEYRGILQTETKKGSRKEADKSTKSAKKGDFQNPDELKAESMKKLVAKGPKLLHAPMKLFPGILLHSGLCNYQSLLYHLHRNQKFDRKCHPGCWYCLHKCNVCMEAANLAYNTGLENIPGSDSEATPVPAIHPRGQLFQFCGKECLALLMPLDCFHPTVTAERRSDTVIITILPVSDDKESSQLKASRLLHISAKFYDPEHIPTHAKIDLYRMEEGSELPQESLFSLFNLTYITQQIFGEFLITDELQLGEPLPHVSEHLFEDETCEQPLAIINRLIREGLEQLGIHDVVSLTHPPTPFLAVPGATQEEPTANPKASPTYTSSDHH